MNWFYNLKTLKKLLLGFSAVCAIMIAVGAVGVVKMRELNIVLEGLYKNQLLGVSHCKTANIKLVQIGRTVRQGVLATEMEEMKKCKAQIADQYAEMMTALDEAETTHTVDAARTAASEVREAIGPWMPLINQAMDQTIAGDNEGAMETLRSSLPLALDTTQKMEKLAEIKVNRGKEQFEVAQSTYAYAFATLCAVITAGVAFATGIGFFIARIVANPLRQAVDVLRRVAGGDFTAELKIDTKDEIGEMAAAMNDAVAKIREALIDVRNVAESLASSSQQLASASEEISSGAQEQASSLEETASSLEEITSTIRQNAENAGQANQLSSGSRAVAEKGGA
ncbi:MAG TPA: MCP four helix bundle domain-containing protein, partial [Pirellulaceae bacterium]|nr:MCP four helix bundle domain-containing protein [Pirellulaceae bacterium]